MGDRPARTTSFQTNWADPGARIITGDTGDTGDTCDWYLEAGMAGTVPRWSPWWSTPTDWYAAFARSHPIRHRGRANYGFVDGHVSRLGPTGSAWGYLDPSKMTE